MSARKFSTANLRDICDHDEVSRLAHQVSIPV
jgi:hypothetical protein